MYFRKVLQNVWTVLAATILIASIGASQVSAQSTYFVDGNGPGSDAFDGSQMSVGLFPAGPFATITKALATATTDGDKIVVLAGNYNANPVLASTKNVSILVRTSGLNVNVLVDGFTSATAGKTLTLGVETNGSGGTFVTNGGANDVTLTSGTINVTGALTITGGATITRTNGALTGNAPTTTVVSVTYTGAITSAISAGNELPANLGVGSTLTFAHTVSLVTVPNNTTAGKIVSSSAGSFTFSGTATTTTVGASSLDFTVGAAGGTATFTGAVTIAGGFNTAAGTSKTINMGATSMGNANFVHASTAGSVVTLASLDLNGINLLNSGTATVTVTGALTLGSAGSATRVNNDATLNAGSVVAEFTDTAGPDVDVQYTLDNAAGKLIIAGAITEYHVLDAGGGGVGDIQDATVGLINASGGSIGIGANTTLGGQIANAERDAGVDGQGIVLSNNANLTLNDQAGAGSLTSIGDIVGGTLTLAYAAAVTDATVTAGKTVTLANNVTFTSAATAAPGAGALVVGGDLRLQEPAHVWTTTFTVTGTLFIEANGQAITGGPHSFGGIDVGSTTGSSFAGAGTIAITGATANFGPTTFAGAITGANAVVNTTVGGSFVAITVKSISASGAGTVTFTTTINTTGGVSIASGTTLAWTAPGGTSDIGGAFDVNGTLAVAGAGAIGVFSMDIDASTGLVATALATVWNFDGSGFTGGAYTDTGTNDTMNFAAPSGGSTVSVKPGTIWNNLGISGAARTVTFTESVNLFGNLTVGNDATVALGENSIVMTGAAKTLTLTDEAAITNTGTNGSVQFKGNAQVITVTGAPNVTPTLTNIVVNNTTGAGLVALLINEPVNIAGTLALQDGGLTINGATGTNAGPIAVTFTGSSAKIARTFPNEGIGIAAGNSIAGVYDLDANGTLGTFGAEYAASQIRNLTISSSGAIAAPATAAVTTGNLTVIAGGASFTTGAALSIGGNATLNGNVTAVAGATFAVGGAMTVVDGVNFNGAGAMTLQFTGNSQTHSIVGFLGGNTTLKISGTGTTINGSIAAGDANSDSEIQNLLVDASADVTANTIQDINGTVTVNGTATLNLVSDGASLVDPDGQITGAVLVNGGGALTVSSNDATVGAFGATVAVNDNGTFTAGSSLGATGDVTVGNGSNATPATFNLNGKTFTFGGGANALTVNASGAPATAPGFGTSGLAVLAAGSQISGGTNATIPNLTVNGGGAPELNSHVTVTGTFTVAAASAILGARNVTLSGANAIGQINAALTSATVGAAGGTLVTTGTTLQSTIGGVVTITNLMVNSSSTTKLATNAVGGAKNNFTVTYFNHNTGAFDLNGQTFTIVGDGAAGTNDWVYTAGTYLATGGGAIVIDNAGATEVDLAAGGASISITNLTTNDTAAGAGLQMGSGDTVTVTGTLTLSGNIQTENTPLADGTFAVANGATVAVTVNPVGVIAGGLFDNPPTLGTGLTYTYATAPGGMTTSNELATTITALTTPTAGAFILGDAFALTTTTLTLNHEFSIDENDDSDNTFTIAAGGTLNIAAGTAGFSDQGAGSAGVFGQADDENYVSAGALTVNSAATITLRPDLLATANTGATLNVTNNILTLPANRTLGAVTVGDGIGLANSATLATGLFTLSATGLAVGTDGRVTGAVNVSGNITSAGNTGGTTITVQGNATLTGGVPGALTFNGTTAQTLTIPVGGFVLTSPITINNAAGLTLAGGNLTTLAGVGGLVLTNGVFATGANVLIITHGGSAVQGFTQTGGCVFGNVRKKIFATGTGTGTIPADRLQYPLCTVGGIQRTFAVTFNDPGVINAASPTVTVRADRGGEGGATDLAGTNGLPQTANGIQIARYPTGPTFFWTVAPSFTMSPSSVYDVELRGNNYTNFSSSCGTTACDINEIFPIRRHVGSNNNLWSVASSTIDNFLSAANSPVVIGRSATGALQTSGTVFTMGLKSIFAAAAGTQTFATTTGNTHVMDLSTLFTGFTGTLTYSGIASSDATAASAGTPAGNNLTITGGATAGATTVTVTATDGFNTTATATFTVNNSAALAKVAVANKTLNVGGTSVVNFADVFSGGAGTVAFTAATSDGAVATVATTATAVTVTAAGTTGSPATITLTATDQSSTVQTMTQTFTVSVNATVTVANTLSNVALEQGKTSAVDVSNVFTGGTIATAYAVTVASADATVASVTLSGTTATVSGVAAYSGSPLTDTAPVTVTVTGTDDLGSSTSTTFTVSVTAVKGDLTGSGGPTAFAAAKALDEYLGLSSPALTAKQLAAADFDGDSDIDPFDAFLIWQASQPAPKRGEVDAFASASLSYGDVTRDGIMVSIPIVVDGSLGDVGSIAFSTLIDPAMATISAVESGMGEGWLVKHTIGEDGMLRIGAAGLNQIGRNGVVAVITLQLADASAQFNIGGEGAVNNNPISAIDDVEVVEIPETFALDGNYPNPFNPTTTIQFDLPETADVEIQVFDMIGRRVMVLPVQTIQAGAKRSLQLNATALASGSYFYRVIAKMESKTLIESGRMTLLK